eukprot:gnl/Dysnectes_brevis/1885_a2167_2226.p1 GENE.gnl/Dysnectes_brevis/1885_a2167_2226~~gnl/Dysnectes_brevis/1885_a2167_2226.p1  ORF type:complete len:247 (-),score=62.04 gnl/Dysnectes_brevis/1885_a2167_2226:67-807(-)
MFEKEKKSSSEASKDAQILEIIAQARKTALHSIHELLPKKYFEMEKMYRTHPLLSRGTSDMVSERLERDFLSLSADGQFTITADDLSKFDGKKKSMIARAARPCPEMEQLSLLVLPQVDQIIHMTSSIVSWLQNSTDKAHNTGRSVPAAVMRECLQEVSRAEEATSAIRDNVMNYHLTRGGLISKLRKHGHWDLYHSLIHLDSKGVLDYRLYMGDLVNNLLVLHDLLHKNMGRLGKQAKEGLRNIY